MSDDLEKRAEYAAMAFICNGEEPQTSYERSTVRSISRQLIDFAQQEIERAFKGYFEGTFDPPYSDRKLAQAKRAMFERTRERAANCVPPGRDRSVILSLAYEEENIKAPHWREHPD